MSHLMGGVIKLLGFLFGLLVLIFTGIQTWSLIFEITQDAIVASVGLVLFEGGTLYWWSIFKHEAKGIMQMALSLLLFVFGLLLMVGSNALHLGAVDPTFLGEQTPQRLILVAAIVSLIGKLLFPLMSPEMTQNIWQRALQGILLIKALAKTEATLEEQAQRIANTLGENMARLVEMDLFTQYQIPHTLHAPRALPASEIATVQQEEETNVIDLQARPARGRAPQPATPNQQTTATFWQTVLNWLGASKQAQPTQPATASDSQPPADTPAPQPADNTPPRPDRFRVRALDAKTGAVIRSRTEDRPGKLRSLGDDFRRNWPYARIEVSEAQLIEGSWQYVVKGIIEPEEQPKPAEYEVYVKGDRGTGFRWLSHHPTLEEAQTKAADQYARYGSWIRIQTVAGELIEEIGRPDGYPKQTRTQIQTEPLETESVGESTRPTQGQ